MVGCWLLWRYPALPGSDDALYLARGVTHFDVLSFAPNFPGYPGLIWLARLFALWSQTPFQALMAVSLVLTLTSAILAGAIYRRLTGDEEGTLFLSLLLLLDPLWSEVALSGLSDGPGLCLLLAAWLASLYRRPALAGALWGLALCVRPSYGVLALVLAGAILHHASARRFVIPAALVGLAALLFVWSANGVAYFQEGWRFFIGHFTIWGDAVGERGQGVSWFSAFSRAGVSGPLWSLMLISGLIATPSLYRRQPAMRPWLLLTIVAVLWCALAQNPRHLRHLIPVIALGWGLFIAAGFQSIRQRERRAILTLLIAIQGIHYMSVSLKGSTLPPIQQAIRWLGQHAVAQAQLVSHHAPDLLREQLPGYGIIDGYYSGDAELAMRDGALRLTSTRPHPDMGVNLCTHFPARLPGDTPLWLIRRHKACP